MFSKKWIIETTQSAIITEFSTFSKRYTDDDAEAFRKKVFKCNDINILNSWFHKTKHLSFVFKQEERDRMYEFNLNNKYCPCCKKHRENLLFRYKKVYLDINNKRRFHTISDNLHKMDYCADCYKEFLKENLLDNDSHARRLLKRQGITNITSEIVKTKKLILLINKQLRNEKES